MNLTWSSAQPYAAFARAEGSGPAFITVAVSQNPITIFTNGADLTSPLDAGLITLGFTKNTGSSPNSITGTPGGSPISTNPFSYFFDLQPCQNNTGGNNFFGIEIIWPQFSIIFTDCTAIATVLNVIQLSNPSLSGFGQIDYYITTTAGTTKIKTLTNAQTLNGSSFVFNFSPYAGQTITVESVYSYYTNNDPTQALLFQATYTQTVNVPLFKSTLSLAASTQAQTPYSSGCVAFIGQAFTVIPSWTLNIPEGVTTENIEGTGQVSATLVYTLLDNMGNVLATQGYDITQFETLPADCEFSFTPATNGDFSIIAVFTTGCGQITEELDIPACSYVTMSLDCKEVTFNNLSVSNTLTLTLYDYTGTNLVDTVTFPTTVPPMKAYDYTLLQDGIYLMKVVSTNGDVFWFPIVSYCRLRMCLGKLIKAIECGRENIKQCTGEEDLRYLLNRIIAIGQTYFSLLQGQYDFNNLYTALSQSFLDDLFTINDLYTKLMKFCDNKCFDHDKRWNDKRCPDCPPGEVGLGNNPEHWNLRNNDHPKNDWDTQNNYQVR